MEREIETERKALHRLQVLLELFFLALFWEYGLLMSLLLFKWLLSYLEGTVSKTQKEELGHTKILLIPMKK